MIFLEQKKLVLFINKIILLPDFTALENIYLASLSSNNNKNLAITKAKIY